MSDVRVSPQGDRIAYFEHPRKWDDRGSVNVVDLAGKNKVLSEGYGANGGWLGRRTARRFCFPRASPAAASPSTL
jgi:hypothetical protein